MHQVQSLSSGAGEGETIRRLQEALQYKKLQKKELNEKLVHLENDIHLQKRKEAMMMDENKQLKEELRNKNKDNKEIKAEVHKLENQLKISNQRNEHITHEKQNELDLLRKEVQRQKDEKQQLREKLSQV